MGLVITNIYLFIFVLAIAFLEIQIEGKDGWARNLPTKRITPTGWKKGLVNFIAGEDNFTLYHIAIETVLFLALAMPFAFGLDLSLRNILKAVSLFLLINPIWDFLWFVLNPYFTWRRFTQKDIPWRKNWLGFIPKVYLTTWIISLVILLPVASTGNNLEIIRWWGANFLLFLSQTFLMVILASVFIKAR